MEQNRFLLSIIIPIYNAEAFLDECLTSACYLVNKSVEIILVDDGSTDDSWKIAKKYAGELATVQVIHQNNEGVSAARNIGIKNATGKYVCFIDSDDKINTDIFNILLGKLENTDIDLILLPHYEGCLEKGYRLVHNGLPEIKDNDFDALYRMTIKQKLNEPWKKIYLRQRIVDNNIKFNINMFMGEDICFFLDYLAYVKSFSYYDFPFYYYLKNETGSCARVNLSYIDQEFMIYRAMDIFIQFNDLSNEFKSENERLLLHKVTRCVQALKNSNVGGRDLFLYLEHNDVLSEIKNIQYRSTVDKIRKWLLLGRMYAVLCYILNMFKNEE